MQPPEERWLERERTLLKDFDDLGVFYRRWCEVNRVAHRITSIIILFCAVLAPVSVASSPDAGLGLFGFSPHSIRMVSLAITLLLAFAEGFRRIFRFDQRWGVCAECR